VFTKILWAKVWLGLGAAAIAFIVLAINVEVALGKRKKRKKPAMPSFLTRSLQFSSLGLISLFIGLAYKESWLVIFQYYNQASFGIIEPIFSNDMAFYIFTLPYYSLILRFIMTLAVLSFIVTVIAYIVSKAIGAFSKEQLIKDGPGAPIKAMPKVSRKAKFHLSGIAAFFFILMAFRYYLNRFQIFYSKLGIVEGAGYTDIHVALPILTLLAVVSVVIAVILMAWPAMFKRKGFLFGIAAVFIGILVLGQGLIPGLFQHFVVDPNEIEYEQPYIENTIRFTRQSRTRILFS